MIHNDWQTEGVTILATNYQNQLINIIPESDKSITCEIHILVCKISLYFTSTLQIFSEQ